MKFKIVLIALIFSLLHVNAQTIKCRASEENAKLYQDNPTALKEKTEFDAFSKKFAAQRASGTLKPTATTYTIPVVFHVYGEIQSGETVTYEKIVNHLKHLNDDFNGRNEDYATVNPFFQARRATLSIEFKLAKLDPQGGCTSGVVFHPAKNGYGNGGVNDAQIAADAWDNKKYMNVYIQNDLYNDGSFYNSGVAWYPNIGMTNNNTARVVFNGGYLYDNSYSTEFAATLTHEFGHFFNLIHTFEGGCSGSDQVADTPEEDGLHTLGCTPGTNCYGNQVNTENYMGYNGASGCYKMFTQGQVTRMLAALQHPARITLWQPQNLVATGVDLSGSYLESTVTVFREKPTNDGAIDAASKITINGTKKFAIASGNMVSGTHFTHNFPAGIVPVLTVQSNNQITVTLTGKATSHAATNSVSAGITFLPAAFVGGSTGLPCNAVFFNLNFIDPYGIFYVDMADVVVNSGTTAFKYFAIAKGDNAGFGGWRFAAYSLKMETYGKRLVCELNSRNIALLAANVHVGATSNFTFPGDYPDQLDLRKTGYTVWEGKTGYVGFEYKIDGEICYGWFKVIVDANGDGYTITEYAYNTKPNEPLLTGQKTVATVLAPSNLNAVTNEAGLTAFLTWTNNELNATNVIVERAGKNGVFVEIATLASTATSYTNTALVAGIAYTYRVRAKKAANYSFYSEQIAVLIPGLPVTPTLDTPTKLGNQGVYPVGFYAKWAAVATATSYEVQLKSGANWVTFDTTSELLLYIPKQGNALQYEFRVRALKGDEISAWSTPFFISLDGSLGITDSEKNTANFIVYPNPVSEVLYFDFGAMDPLKIKIKIYNTNGVLLAQLNTTSFAVRALPAGMYVVVATDGTHTVHKKIVVH